MLSTPPGRSRPGWTPSGQAYLGVEHTDRSGPGLALLAADAALPASIELPALVEHRPVEVRPVVGDTATTVT